MITETSHHLHHIKTCDIPEIKQERKMSTEEKIQLNNKKKIQHSQLITVYLMIYDCITVSAAFFLALWLRYDLQLSTLVVGPYFKAWFHFTPFYAVFCIVIFWLLKLYKSIWRFASFKELQRVTLATCVTAIIHTIAITFIITRMPITYYVVGAFFQFVFTVGIRFSYRFILLLRAKRNSDDEIPTLLIGGGSGAILTMKEIDRSEAIKDKVVCIIDDNKNKWNRDIDGVLVVGGRDKIIETVEKYGIKKIYLAIPSLSAKERKKILDICKETDCEIKTLPGMYQVMLGKISVSSYRNVEIEDLLGREPVKMGSRELREYLSGKTVLITGGGGSIGSELCRQVAASKTVKRLIIFDIYENNAHAIKLELIDKYPELDLVTLIGSVRNSRRVKELFEKYRPEIVFHAAAHKHVPLMEDSPCEAIKNNVIGTYYTAFAAMAYGSEKFVLISTDKAVNPVNIMGASKRLCEMIVQTFAKKVEEGKAMDLPDLHADTGTNRNVTEYISLPAHPKTEFVAVRFGNVLGSNGSVIPRFKEQLAAGGPLTVTHPDIIRYFMTIPEAASLVLTTATFGGGGKIFVLDMGTPVKIDDLARNMIKLAGLKPDEDIKIVYTGLRPGEKLYEERLMDEEGLKTTSNELINIGSPIEFDENKFIDQLKELMIVAYEDREDDIRDFVAKVVTTYHPAGKHGTEEKGEVYEQQMMDMLAKRTPKL